MSKIIGSIITDCADDNAKARQKLKFSSLFGVQPAFYGVGANAPDIEAAGNLLDQLDIIRDHQDKAVILVNVAPRGDEIRKKWDNGTPFCYFWVSNTLVVGAYAGRCFGLAQARGLVKSVHLLDIPEVTTTFTRYGDLNEKQAITINNTQFRSLNFLPLVASWILDGKSVPSRKVDVEPFEEKLGLVWAVDNFGNTKTTLLPKDVQFKEGRKIKLFDGKFATCHKRLADVPKGETALIMGSSGYGADKFLEVVVQWEDGGFSKSDKASTRHNLAVGSKVLSS